MDIKISVIIPVYNVEKTLKRCIESVLNQSFKEYEIILVDDGSPDNSGKICDEYAEKYEFIKVIHKENEGLGPTRNTGVRAAKGKYIYHCDSDDWIDPDLLLKAYNSAEENNSDVVIFGYTMFTEGEENINHYKTIALTNKLIDNNEDARKFFVEQFRNSYIVQSACNRLLKRQFLIDNEIWFKPFRRCQDIAFSIDLFDKVCRLSTMDESFYNYIIAPGTYKGRSLSEMLSIYLDVFEIICSAFKKWGLLDNQIQKELASLYISRISNYFSYYLVHKSNNQSQDLDEFLNNKRVKNLFSSVTIKNISSRFLRMLVLNYRFRLKFILKKILISHQKKVEK